MWEKVYGPKAAAAQKRADEARRHFAAAFGHEAQAVFSAPGRTEIGGNHTDHQHGHILAGAVDLDMMAAVRVTGTGTVKLHSEGYDPIEVDLALLTPRMEEVNTTAALIRGVAAGLAERGCPLEGVGLEIAMSSAVPGGSGLSSSAAFEILIGTVLNELFWGGRATPVELAQVGQYAENIYFGKPSGLMDQLACSVGGVVAVDFADPKTPVVERIDLDLRGEGYCLCIIDSGAGHADLTGEYAAVTGELKAVCDHFGKAVLREVPEADFHAALPRLRMEVGDRAVLRAIHFYADDRRAAQEAQALKRGDFQGFLELVRASGKSSAMFLQNIVPNGQTFDQSLMLTLALCEDALQGRGACRVHGGGFGGTAQAFVPLELADVFREKLEAVLGPGKCHTVTIRPAGGVRLA